MSKSEPVDVNQMLKNLEGDDLPIMRNIVNKDGEVIDIVDTGEKLGLKKVLVNSLMAAPVDEKGNPIVLEGEKHVERLGLALEISKAEKAVEFDKSEIDLLKDLVKVNYNKQSLIVGQIWKILGKGKGNE